MHDNPITKTAANAREQMINLKMAFRNIFRQRRRSLLTGLMMMGGFVLFSVAVGIADGGYGSMIDMFTRDHTGHIQIHKPGYLDRPSLYKTIQNEEFITEKILKIKQVRSVSPRVFSPALAFFGTKTTGAQVVGIDPVKESQTTRIAQKVNEGRFISEAPLNEIFISNSLAEVLKVRIGDQVALIGQGADGSIANDIFEIVGITAKSGSSFERMNCYMHIKTAQHFLALSGRIHEIAVLLDDQGASRAIAAQIAESLKDESLDVAPWQVVEKQFYEAMQADKRGNYIVQVVIMIIVAIGVLNTVLMSILERTREFGVMRAVGTRPGSIFRLILFEISYLSIISISAGAVLGVLINYYLSVHGISFPEPIEYGGMSFYSFPSVVSAKTLWLPACVTYFTAMIVSVFPALRAARITPVTAMSTH
jgi:putative ABC transport system permease protein